MSDPINLVKQLNKAFETKDAQAFRALLHPQYTFKGPLMQMASPEEAAEFLKSCPFKANSENVQFIAAGDHVVQTFDWIVKEPFQGTIRMCECITIKDGKIFAGELFYDSAKFPKEVLESMKANAQ